MSVVRFLSHSFSISDSSLIVARAFMVSNLLLVSVHCRMCSLSSMSVLHRLHIVSLLCMKW